MFPNASNSRYILYLNLSVITNLKITYFKSNQDIPIKKKKKKPINCNIKSICYFFIIFGRSSAAIFIHFAFIDDLFYLPYDDLVETGHL